MTGKKLLIYLAARLVSSARGLKLPFRRHCSVFEAFVLVYSRLSGAA
jgi:hypothetical protein